MMQKEQHFIVVDFTIHVNEITTITWISWSLQNDEKVWVILDVIKIHVIGSMWQNRRDR